MLETETSSSNKFSPVGPQSMEILLNSELPFSEVSLYATIDYVSNLFQTIQNLGLISSNKYSDSSS